jgi:hypothetical protein
MPTANLFEDGHRADAGCGFQHRHDLRRFPRENVNNDRPRSTSTVPNTRTTFSGVGGRGCKNGLELLHTAVFAAVSQASQAAVFGRRVGESRCAGGGNKSNYFCGEVGIIFVAKHKHAAAHRRLGQDRCR